MKADSPSPMFLRVSLKAFQRLRKEVPDLYAEMVNEISTETGYSPSTALRRLANEEMFGSNNEKLPKDVSDFLLAFLFASMMRSPTWEQTVSESANKRKQMQWKKDIIKDMGLIVGDKYYSYDPENPRMIPSPQYGGGWNGGDWEYLLRAVRDGDWNYVKSTIGYEDRAYVFTILNKFHHVYETLINWEYTPVELSSATEDYWLTGEGEI